MSLDKLNLSIETLKSTANPFAKADIAEKTLDEIHQVLISQAEELGNVTLCVNFLQKTIERLTNGS